MKGLKMDIRFVRILKQVAPTALGSSLSCYGAELCGHPAGFARPSAQTGTNVLRPSAQTGTNILRPSAQTGTNILRPSAQTRRTSCGPALRQKLMLKQEPTPKQELMHCLELRLGCRCRQGTSYWKVRLHKPALMRKRELI